MGVTCQILAYKPEDGAGVYYTGQPVTGKVRYDIKEPKKYEAIVVSLIGTGKCKWHDSDSDSTYTYKGSEEYVARHVNILPYAAVLQPGSYEHDYQFHLPENIPSSYKNDHCKIMYRIQMKFERLDLLNFTTAKKFQKEIPVYEVFEASDGPVIIGVDKTLLNLFSRRNNYIKLTAEVVKTCFRPGENVEISMLLKNDTDDRPTVKARLLCYMTLTSNSGKQHRKTTDKIKDCFATTPAIKERTIMEFILSIPTRGELYTISSKVMRKEYRLQVKVVLPAPHRNAVVEMPISIGEQKGRGGFELEDMSWEAMLEDLEE